MGRLIIVAGAGGAGKSFFLRKWEELDPDNTQRIKKYVSKERAPRRIEVTSGESDLIFSSIYDPNSEEGKAWYATHYPGITPNSKLQFHNKEFTKEYIESRGKSVYKYHASHYEVNMDGIEEALSKGLNPIVIVRKSETILYLLSIYSDALVIYVQSILSGNDLIEKLEALGESKDDAEKRQGRNKEDLNDYIENIQRLPRNPRVVINDYNEEDNGAVSTQILDIIDEEIVRHTSIKARSIFVIESYLSGGPNIDVAFFTNLAAQQVIKDPSVARANFRQDGSYKIDDHVFKQINENDIIVCDVSNDRCLGCEQTNQGDSVSRYQGTSANVWIELGYAIKALQSRGVNIEKHLIITAKKGVNSTKIPLDLGGDSRYVIRYEDAQDFIEQIKNQLKNMINQ